MGTVRDEVEDLAGDIETRLMMEYLEEHVGHITQVDIDNMDLTPLPITDEEREAILANRARAEAVLRQKYGYEF